MATYSKEFKEEAIRLSDEIGNKKAAAQLEILYYTLADWRNRSGSKSTLEPTKWGHTTVKKILTLQEYCGDVINFKSYSKSYKMKRRIENPEENRAIFLNVHEPIIDGPLGKRCRLCRKAHGERNLPLPKSQACFLGG